MIKVTIIGSGGVAEALALALSECEPTRVQLLEIAGRNAERVEEIATLAGCRPTTIEGLSAEADIYVMAVSDDAIVPLSQQIEIPQGRLLLHTAGSVSMEGFSGVLYPMQSFTKGRKVDFRSVPIFIEGVDKRALATIKSLAENLSDSVRELSSQGRVALHISAVFACNFTNAMLSAAHTILTQHEIPFELYRPLIEETISKALDPTTTPREAQTGVARRGDFEVQARHLKMLAEDKNLSEIYKITSKYIWETSKRI